MPKYPKWAILSVEAKSIICMVIDPDGVSQGSVNVLHWSIRR